MIFALGISYSQDTKKMPQSQALQEPNIYHNFKKKPNAAKATLGLKKLLSIMSG